MSRYDYINDSYSDHDENATTRNLNEATCLFYLSTFKMLLELFRISQLLDSIVVADLRVIENVRLRNSESRRAVLEMSLVYGGRT